MKKKEMMFFLSIAVSVVSLSFAVIWSVQERFWPVFAASFLAWAGYAFGHYVVNGSVVDKSEEGIDISNFTADESFVFGIVLMVMAFPTGIIAVNMDSLTLMMFAQSLFFGGYIAGHKAVTGELL